MELTHSFAVPASIDQAWALFMDLREVGECFPGASVTEVTDDGFTGQVKVRLGPIAMVYAGTGRITAAGVSVAKAVQGPRSMRVVEELRPVSQRTYEHEQALMRPPKWAE